MNFKINLFLLLSCIFLLSCGLKTKPRAPKETKLPSLSEEFTKHYKTSNESVETKKKKSK